MTPASESLVAFTMIMNRMILSSFLALRRRPRAQPLLLLPELGAQRGTEVVRLEHLANLHVAFLEGGSLQPLDGLIPRLHLPQPEAGDQLLRLREGPVGHGPLASVEPDPHALRARLESLACEHHAGLRQLLVELPHLGQDLLVREDARFRVLVRFDDHHESHRKSPFGSEPGSGRSRPDLNPGLYCDDERTLPGSTQRPNFFAPPPSDGAVGTSGST